MSEIAYRVTILLAAIAVGVMGGYYFGFIGASSMARTGDAAVDLLLPAEDYRSSRLRKQALRTLLTSMMERQQASFAATDSFLPQRSLLEAEGLLDDRPDFHLQTRMVNDRRWAREGRQPRRGWIAWIAHDMGPVGEGCAVAVGIDEAYLSGIPVPAAGRVRCSWDLATRVNRFRRGVGFTTP